jgi:hypothetical protein
MQIDKRSQNGKNRPILGRLRIRVYVDDGIEQGNWTSIEQHITQKRPRRSVERSEARR